MPDPESTNADGEPFTATGRLTITVGLLPDGSETQVWSLGGIDPAKALGLLDIVHERLKWQVIQGG